MDTSDYLSSCELFSPEVSEAVASKLKIYKTFRIFGDLNILIDCLNKYWQFSADSGNWRELVVSCDSFHDIYSPTIDYQTEN